MNTGRGLVVSFLSLLVWMSPIVSRAQGAPLRDGADDRGLYIGAAVAMTPFRGEAAYVNTLRREFNMIVAENAFKWDALRPSRTTYNFTDADALVSFAQANNMVMRGHTLVWHNQLPGWLTSGNFTRDEVIQILRDHITTLVTRYRGIVVAWDVVNEAIDDSNGALRNSFWFQRLGQDYIRMAFEFARQADPNVKLYYNDYSIEGTGTKSNAVFNLVSNLKSQGVPIDGVGWQMHQINPFTISAANQTNATRLAGLGLEISMTETDIRIALPTTADELQQQAQGYRAALNFCLAQSNCKAFVTWGFTDKYSWVPGTFSGQGDALIFDTNYQPKPAYNALNEVLNGSQPPPPTPPATPTGLTATAGNAQVTLSWSASSGATSYNVKRATTNGGPYTTIATGVAGTSYTNTGLTNGTTYFYVVSAVNANGESANSGQVSATPQGTTTPPPGACSATYQVVNQWGNGFIGQVTITNTGTTPLNGWVVRWTFSGNQQITNIWNGALTRNGQSMTVNNMPYNGVVQPNGSTSFGFQAGFSGTNAIPTVTCSRP